jgi:hypothetical protein
MRQKLVAQRNHDDERCAEENDQQHRPRARCDMPRHSLVTFSTSIAWRIRSTVRLISSADFNVGFAYDRATNVYPRIAYLHPRRV